MIPPGTRSRARAAFEQFLAAEQPGAVLFAHPVLLRADVLDAIVDPAGEDEPAAAEALQEAAHQLDADPTRFRLGSGPIERIWDDLSGGTLTFDSACAAARGLQVTEHLVPSYLLALFTGLQRRGIDLDTWRPTREQGRILLAAVEACDRRREPAMEEASWLGQVRWVHGLLYCVPDRRLAEQGDRAGRKLIERCRSDPRRLAAAEFEVAAMWGDPYVANRSTSSAVEQDRAWRLRGVAENTERDRRPAADWEMPAPADGLAVSLAHWRGAAQAASEDPAILIGLAEAGAFRSVYTDTPPEPDVADAIVRGAALARDDPVLSARFAGMATFLGLGIGDTTPEQPYGPVDTVDSDTLVARLREDAAPTVAREFERSQRADPRRALDLAERHSELLRDPQQLDDQVFRTFAQHLVDVLDRVHGSAQTGDGTGPYEARVESVLDRLAGGPEAGGPEPTSVAVATTLLKLGVDSTAADAELRGLRLVQSAREAAPLFARRYDWLFALAEADLLLGQAVNCYRAEDRIGAVRWYLRALDRWIGVGREEPVVNLLQRLAHIAGWSATDDDAVAELVGLLADLAPRLGGFAGSSVPQLVEQIHMRVLGGMVESKAANSELVWATLQYAKGYRSATMLQRTSAPPARRDQTLAAIVDRLADPTISTGGAQALRAAFERRRRQVLIADLPAPSPLGQNEAISVLDDRTVLLSSWTIRYADGSWGRLAYLVASDDTALLATTPYAEEDELPLLPNVTEQVLAEHAERGRDHLCVIPDGRLLTADLHTLPGPGGGLLADQWMVSLLPHPDLLWEGRGGPQLRPRRLLPMVGVGIDRAPGLDPLPNAEAEAAAVVDLYRGSAAEPVLLPGGAATAQAFLKLAPTSRRLHVATHGEADREAPSFQWLAFADCRLPAWEVAELDLRQVDLVTLSACDSAELVISEGENLDGLAMAFLSAGARTVVGSDRPIRSDASELFFTVLHRAVGSGETDLRRAFRAAQTAVRRDHPDDRIWGAFYLLGDWL